MNQSVTALGVVIVAFSLVGCSGSEKPAATTVTKTAISTATSTVTVASSAAPAAPIAPGSPAESAPPQPAETWIMPDLIGRNLQAAQDAIQSLTANSVFFSGSTDLTGRGRAQIVDRNWQVCTSTPSPGESFSTTTKIDFGVVKDSESCP